MIVVTDVFSSHLVLKILLSTDFILIDNKIKYYLGSFSMVI